MSKRYFVEPERWHGGWVFTLRDGLTGSVLGQSQNEEAMQYRAQVLNRRDECPADDKEAEK